MFITPDRIVNALRVRDDMRVAEFGAGAGDFALNLAKRMPNGQVFAIDVQREPLSALDSKAEAAGVYNIRTITGDLEEKEGSTLTPEYLDIVLIPNVLFQVEDRKAVLDEAARVLKKGGQLLILDWNEGDGLGPSKEMRVSHETVLEEAEGAGFSLKKEVDAGRFHWALVLEKN